MRMGRRTLVGKSEGKITLGNPTQRWEYNIKIDIRKIDFGCVDWIQLALNRDRWRAVVSTVRSIQHP
jgi:hypothetical protein